MKNVLTIDVRNNCECDAVFSYDTRTNQILVELIVGDVTSPQLEIYDGDVLSSTVNLTKNTTNIVTIPESCWNIDGHCKFRYKDSGREGATFTIYFPSTLVDIYLIKSTDTTFTIVSKTASGKYLTTDDIVDDLNSTDILKALSANQGNILSGKINDANTNIDTLTKSLNTLIQGEDVSNKDFDSLPWRSFVGYGVNMTNDPVKNSQCAYLVQQIYSKQQILQIAIALNWQNGDLIYYRRFRNGWGSWYRFANTEQIATINTSITEINNNLGATLDPAGDANNIKKTCILRTNSDSTNVKDTNGLLLTFVTQGGQCRLQINTSFNSSNSIYIRTNWYGTWYAWEKNICEKDLTATLTEKLVFPNTKLTDIDNPPHGVSMTIIDNNLYISLMYDWIALEFRVSSVAQPKVRRKYGQSGWTAWQNITLS